MQIGFNSKFLIEMLNNLDSEITLSCLSNRADILKVNDDNNVKESITMMTMQLC